MIFHTFLSVLSAVYMALLPLCPFVLQWMVYPDVSNIINNINITHDGNIVRRDLLVCILFSLLDNIYTTLHIMAFLVIKHFLWIKEDSKTFPWQSDMRSTQNKWLLWKTLLKRDWTEFGQEWLFDKGSALFPKINSVFIITQVW